MRPALLTLLLLPVRGVLVKPRTPVRGWNSFDFGDGTERPYNTPDVPTLLSLVKAVEANLLPYGYEYFTVDGGWFDAGTPGLPTNSSAPTVDAWGRPAPKPDTYPELSTNGWKPIADAAHAAGLKFGIWWILGVPTAAVERKLPIKGSRYTADQIVRHTSDGSDWGACMWDHSTYRTNFSHPGTLDYFRSVVELWEEWGVDLIKLDCTYSGGNVHHGHPGIGAAIDVFSELISNSSRPIVLSLSPGNPDPALLAQTSSLLTMARITTDFHPNWPAILQSFETANALAPVAHQHNVLADLDCLPFGVTNGRPENNDPNWPSTMRTIMTLWTISRSPLIFGGDPRSLWRASIPSAAKACTCPAPDNATFHCGLPNTTRQLLTNIGILNASGDALAPAQLKRQGSTIVWSAGSTASPHNTRYVAVFNAPPSAKAPGSASQVTVTLAELGLTAAKSADVTDLLDGGGKPPHHAAASVQASPEPFDAAFFKVVASGAVPAPSVRYRCEKDTCVVCASSGGSRAECEQVCGPPRVKHDDEGSLTAVEHDGAAAAPLDPTPSIVAQWTTFESGFKSDRPRTALSSYMDIDLNATFTLPSDPSQPPLITPCFWDGGSTWRVRFAPPRQGLWRFSTSCNDHGDEGLHNRSGAVQAVAYNGTVPALKHGFVRPSRSNRFLEHSDGLPFFWLGDTHWSGLNSAEHMSDSNDPQFKSMFKAMVQTRVAQGFTVWKAETFATEKNGGRTEAGYAWGSQPGGFLTELNPAFWQSVDQRLQYVVASGLVPSFAFAGAGAALANRTDLPRVKRLARYAVARYASLPVIWTGCQEWCLSQCSGCWAEVGALTFELDPHKRANTLNSCESNPMMYHDQDWYGFVALQEGHGDGWGVRPVDYWLEQYRVEPPRPIIEDEANYEEHGTVEPWMTRQSAWQAIIAGAAGYTYGAQGIWWACYDLNYSNGNCGTVGSPGYRTWIEALRFPVGSQHMGILRRFWTALDWWRFEPDETAISWGAGAATGSQRPFQKSINGTGNANHSASWRRTVVAYLPQTYAKPACGNSTYTGIVQGLDRSLTYAAHYFCPRTAAFSRVAVDPVAVRARGEANVPAQPSAEDWVFLLQSTDDANAVVASVPLSAANPDTTTSPQRSLNSVEAPESDVESTATSFVSSIYSLGEPRRVGTINGMRVKIGSKPIRLTSLGRYHLPGNFGSHELSVYTVPPNSTVKTRSWSVQLSMSCAKADSLGFKYTPLLQSAGGLQLNASQFYDIISFQLGMDTWHTDTGTNLSTNTAAGTIVGSVYLGSKGFILSDKTPGAAYGPMNFLWEPVSTEPVSTTHTLKSDDAIAMQHDDEEAATRNAVQQDNIIELCRPGHVRPVASQPN